MKVNFYFVSMLLNDLKVDLTDDIKISVVVFPSKQRKDYICNGKNLINLNHLWTFKCKDNCINMIRILIRKVGSKKDELIGGFNIMENSIKKAVQQDVITDIELKYDGKMYVVGKALYQCFYGSEAEIMMGQLFESNNQPHIKNCEKNCAKNI